jgi:hypothetical protein
MPEIDYGKANAKVSKINYDYPKLKLGKDEKARIVLIEKSPVFEWVHELRRPKIVDGVPQMETKQRRDKTEYQDHVMDFLSKPICLGDAGTLDNDGLDPKNCPVCALAKRNPDATKAPVRRFATHVIRYQTRGGTYDITNPFSVEVLVWSFTERMFAQISEFREDWGDLRAKDLNLLCTNQTFQNYDINVASKTEYLTDDARTQIVKAAYANNRIEDLTIACGRQTEERWLLSDIQKIEEAWAEVSAIKRGSPSTTSLMDDLGAIAQQDGQWAAQAPAADEPASSAPAQAVQQAQKPAPAASSTDLDAMFDGIDTAPAREKITDEPAAEEITPEAPAPEAPKSAPAAPAPAAAANVTDDLDALLGA